LAATGIFVGMEAATNRLYLLASVRCLDCGDVYAKPTVGGTSEMNPGCPVCSYVGWIPVSQPTAPRRSSVGRPPRFAARFR
jgi:hypothetical protein